MSNRFDRVFGRLNRILSIGLNVALAVTGLTFIILGAVLPSIIALAFGLLMIIFVVFGGRAIDRLLRTTDDQTTQQPVDGKRYYLRQKAPHVLFGLAMMYIAWYFAMVSFLGILLGLAWLPWLAAISLGLLGSLIVVSAFIDKKYKPHYDLLTPVFALVCALMGIVTATWVIVLDIKVVSHYDWLNHWTVFDLGGLALLALTVVTVWVNWPEYRRNFSRRR
jgi:hypothetical protein